MFGSRTLNGVFSRTQLRSSAWRLCNSVKSVQHVLIPAVPVSCGSMIVRNHSFFSESKRPKLTLKERLQRQLDKLRENPEGKISTAATMGLGASVLFSKGKYILVGLKLAKLAPLVSMVVSTGAYAMFFGWPYACGMVGLIFVHELGHALAMKHYRIPFSPMVFVPFMGAVIAMESPPKNVHDEAIVALAGPVLGSIGALTCAGVATLGTMGVVPSLLTPTSTQLFYALADWGYMINLFNLLPIGSLDGGRISSAISPWLGVAGIGAGGLMVYSGVVHNPLFYIILLSGTWTTGSRMYSKYKHGTFDPEKPWGYFDISSVRKFKITSYYFGLIALLIYAMYQNNRFKKSPHQLQIDHDYGYDNSIYQQITKDFYSDEYNNNDYYYYSSRDRYPSGSSNSSTSNNPNSYGYGIWRSSQDRDDFYEAITTIITTNNDDDDEEEEEY